MMTYTQSLEFLYNSLPIFHRQGAAAYKADLGNTETLMQMLDNPYKAFRSIHVAGTNGKGSTSHFLASILFESGIKTGLHTSPHLRDLRERISVDGKLCSKVFVSRFLERWQDRIAEIQPSFFELMVAMAFHHFKQKKVDTAVIEVGMGGRLDSTNVISPEVCIITNISWDHMQFLGDTLPKIAKEKAGIIKHKTPIVISQTQEEVKQVFINKAKEMDAPIFFADENYSAKNIRRKGNLLIMDIYRKDELFIKDLTSPLSGDYQVKNILGVMQVVEVLNQSKKYHITKNDIKKGLANLMNDFPLRGRWQTLSENPRTLCDTGHNEDGLTYVLNQLKREEYDTLRFVFGVVNDKEVDKEIEMLPKEALYYLCKADIPRGLDVNILAEKMEKANMQYKVFSSVKEALKNAQKDALKSKKNDLVFIGGSTYTVAEIV
ncbi:MAG: bifunctional folylpolyglutamate synthase/dihydrofolate synthase [Bacteroidales bacterium]|nr:bifunctional folylpolyglutamate synthase/dihydrofolate synthase [Candidatus Scybalousia scybalohippi]